MTNRNWHTHARTLLVVAVTFALVLWAPAAALGPAIGTAAAQEGRPPQTPASYYGNVTIDGEPAPAGTTIEAVVDGRVAGSITIDEAGRYGGPDALDEKLSVGGNQTIQNGTEVLFYVDNENIDRTLVNNTEPATVEWEAGDVQRVDLAAAAQEPYFAVGIADAPANVTAGSNIPITLNITNTGVAEGENRTINVSVDGEVRQRTTETLAVGASTQTLVQVPTSAADVGTVTVTADTGDETVSTTVEVDAPPEFTVTGLSLPETTVNASEFVNGTVTVQNTGDLRDTQNLTVTVGDAVANDTSLTLDAGESRAVDFAYRTSEADVGTQVVTAATEDDSNSTVVTVNAGPTFAVNVIESESKLDVVAGENATIVAEIENVGGSAGTRTVNVTRDDTATELTSRDIELAPGEITGINASATTSSAGTFNLTVNAGSDGSETELVNVTEPEEASFDVTITDIDDSVDEPLPRNTTNISVDVAVENLGGQPATQDIDFRVDGERRNSSRIALDDGESDTLSNVLVPVRPGETPSVDVTVASENDTATRTVDVNATAQFDVRIVDRSNRSQVTTAKPFAPTINVTNVGGQSGDGLLRVRFNGTLEKNVSITGLAPGEEIEVVNESNIGLNASTTGTKLVEADVVNNGTDAVDDVSTRKVAVGQAPNFSVESITLQDPSGNPLSGTINQSETIEVVAKINNTGDAVGENRTVAIEFDGTEVGAEVLTLKPAETRTVSTTYSTRAADVGTRSVTVSTGDDVGSKSITVLENAEFEIRNVDAADSVVAGENASVDVTVENVGGLAGNTTDVRLFAAGSEVASKTVTLDAGETRVVQFDNSEAVPTTAAGDLEVTAVSDDDIGSDTIAVGEPGELDLELVSLTDPVTNESTLSANVRATNVGDGPATETVALRFEDDSGSVTIVDSKTITVGGGNSTIVGLSYGLDRTLDSESVEAEVEIDAANDTISETVTIQQPPDAPDFRVSDLNAPASVLETEKTVNVTATVTNVGDRTGTQTIELVVGGEVRDTRADLELSGGKTASVDLAFNASNVSTGDVAYAIESANESTGGSITVKNAVPGTAEIVSTKLLGDTATQEETFRINATVENTGDLNATNETVRLAYADQGTVDSTEIELLKPGATTTVTLSVTPPSEPRAGTFDRVLTIQSNDTTVNRTVPVDFGGIQSGVAAASEGETVLIAAGTYEERNAITIDTRGISLEPAGRSMPTVQSPRQSSTGLVVNASDVSVSNLRFVGDGSGTAVVLDGDNATLRNVQIRNWETGIDERSGTNRIVAGSVVNTGTGIVLDGAGNSRIEFTRVVGAETQGIRVTSPQNTLLGVSVFGSNIGIDISGAGAEDNRIEQSIVRGNDDVGVRVANVPPGEESGPGAPSAFINNSALEANGVEALIDNSTVNASQNWWGTINPEENVEYVVRSGLNLDPATSRPASEFNVTLGSSFDTVRGQTITVPATVTNDGTKVDLQTVQLLADGSVVDSLDVQLAAGETKTRNELDLTYTPTLSDGADVDFTVRSLDDSATETNVAVLEPAFFDVPSVGAPAEVTAGQTLQITPKIDNTGEAQATQTVRLLINGSEVDTASVTLGSGDTQPTLTYSTTAADVGTVNVTVVTADATRSTLVSVLEADDTDPGPNPGDGDDGGGPVSTPAVAPAVESVTPALQDGRRVATFETVESVQSIALETTESVGEVSVAQVDPADSPVPDAPGTTLTLQNISVPADVEDTAATITFSVSADAVDGDPSNLRVFRYSEGDWQALETRVVEETDTGVVLEADTPGFSYFAVSEVSQPEAAISLQPTTATAGSDVTLSAEGSTVEEGEIVAYEWTIDGETYSGETVTVALDQAGDYTVELTVRTDANATDTATETLSIEAADTATSEPDTPAEVTPTDEPTQEPGGFNIVAIVAVLALLAAAGYALYQRS